MTTDTITEMLRQLRPADADDLDEWLSPAERDALLHEVMSVARPTRRARRRTTKTRRRRRQRLIPAAGALAAAAAVAVLVISSGGETRSAPAVSFRDAADGQIIARVTNPLAAKQTLDAEFAAHDLNITVNLVPVSPSLVGTVVYISDTAGANAIAPLQNGSCVSGGGACPIGLKLPADFTGQGYITLGRAAQPGESYDSTVSAFAPGEALHCSGLLGARVSSASSVLQAHGLTVAQWRASKRVAARAPSGNYIWQIDPVSATTVRVWTEPTPPPTTSASSADNAGCARAH